jgi:hypothetical protein
MGLIYNKVTSRSYSYFQKIAYFNFLKNWLFQLCQKLQSLVEKTQGILGVNAINSTLHFLHIYHLIFYLKIIFLPSNSKNIL